MCDFVYPCNTMVGLCIQIDGNLEVFLQVNSFVLLCRVHRVFERPVYERCDVTTAFLCKVYDF